jgi:transposase-like protein
MTMASDDRQTVAAILMLQGHTQKEISQQLGVAQNTVSVWLSEIAKEWKERAFADRQARIAEALAKLDLVEKMLWMLRDFKLVLRCLDMRFKVLGAYKPDTVIVQQPIPWDAILDAQEAAKVPLEDRMLVDQLRAMRDALKNDHTNGDTNHE